MSEPSNPPPFRSALLAAVADELHQVVPGWRWIAQDLLADASRIDLFGVDEQAAAVIVGVGDTPPEVALLGRVLAQRHWLAPRLADWLKLAPALGVRPDRPVRAVLVCEDPGVELCAAVRSLALPWLQLVRRHPTNGVALRRPGAGLLEPLGVPRHEESPDAPRQVAPPSPPPVSGNATARPRPTEGLPAAPFRTGLTDADLGLTPIERAEFDPRGPR